MNARAFKRVWIPAAMWVGCEYPVNGTSTTGPVMSAAPLLIKRLSGWESPLDSEELVLAQPAPKTNSTVKPKHFGKLEPDNPSLMKRPYKRAATASKGIPHEKRDTSADGSR